MSNQKTMQLINNEGNPVEVSKYVYDEVRKGYDDGVWMMYVKDTNGHTQIVETNQLSVCAA